MRDRIEQAERLLTLLYKFELHAFVLLLTGAGMTLSGHKEEGLAIIATALVIFKGKN